MDLGQIEEMPAKWGRTAHAGKEPRNCWDLTKTFFSFHTKLGQAGFASSLFEGWSEGVLGQSE
jgi:hypothetical protein